MLFTSTGAGVQASAPASEKGEAVSLKPYNTTVNGYETTLMLSDEDAKKQGLLKGEPKTDAKQAEKPANKARKAPNKKG